MVLFTSVFLFNMLCAIVPCDPNYGTPEIDESNNRIGRGHHIGFRNSLSADDDDSIVEETEPKVLLENQGFIEGYTMSTIGARKIYAFEGIPYAEAPIDQRRFQPPVAKGNWSGILQTKKPGPYCLQFNFQKLFRVIGDEDCLHLNVFTPELPTSHLNNPQLPVVVYIHGGSYLFGSGSEQGPSYLLDQDVILVSLNYRLGVLGFLSTGDEAGPGNYGLKDQALAIKWVHDNIEKFGGDPNRVTIMGQSAGGASVHLHLISNQTRNYYQNAVSISGSAFTHWGFITRERSLHWTNKMAKLMRCPSTDENTKNLMDCLRTKDPNFLVGNQLNLFEWFPSPPVLFGPTVEPESPTAFLTETPEESYARNHTAAKPWIATMTKQEGYTGLFLLNTLLRMGALRNHWHNLAKYALDFNYIAHNRTDELTEKITKQYFGDVSPKVVSLDQMSDIATDRFFTFGMYKSIQIHSEIAPTYSYLFSYKGKFNLANLAGIQTDEWGVGHNEDIYYYYNNSYTYTGYKSDDPDYQMSRLLVNLLANFATHGEPLYTTDEGDDIKIWDPVTNTSDIKVLQMDKEVKMISQPFVERIKFWESLKLKDAVPFVSLRPNNSVQLSETEVKVKEDEIISSSSMPNQQHNQEVLLEGTSTAQPTISQESSQDSVSKEESASTIFSLSLSSEEEEESTSTISSESLSLSSPSTEEEEDTTTMISISSSSSTTTTPSMQEIKSS